MVLFDLFFTSRGLFTQPLAAANRRGGHAACFRRHLATTAQQQKEIAALAATVKEQAAQIQKVSAQLDASKPASHVVNNP